MWIFKPRPQWPDMYFGTDFSNIKRQVAGKQGQVLYLATISNQVLFDNEQLMGLEKTDSWRRESTKRSRNNSESSCSNAKEKIKKLPPVLVLNPSQLTMGNALDELNEASGSEDEEQASHIDDILTSISIGYSDEAQCTRIEEVAAQGLSGQ